MRTKQPKDPVEVAEQERTNKIQEEFARIKRRRRQKERGAKIAYLKVLQDITDEYEAEYEKLRAALEQLG